MLTPAMTTTLVSLANPAVTRLLHEVFVGRSDAAHTADSPAEVSPLIEAGLVQVHDGNLRPVDRRRAEKIIFAAFDDWLPGIVDKAS